MRNNIETFENFNKNHTIVNFKDLNNNKGDSDWNPRKSVSKSNGLLTYVMGDRRIRDIENEIYMTDSITKKIELKNKITELRKDKANSIQRWVYKESPSSSDKVLYMKPKQAKEVNACLELYQQEKKRYNEYINKYSQINPNS